MAISLKPIHPLNPSNPMAVEHSDSNEEVRSDPDPERLALIRARQGDRDAFRELVDRHKDRAFGVALRVLRSAPDAEEVTQDAFVRAWTALPAFRGESKFGTWLYAIVMRCALDRAATLKTRRARETDLEAAADRPAGAGGMESDEWARLTLRMERTLDQLSEAQRAVVTLFYYEERSVEEVAATLTMPAGTVKTHLSRARAALRDAWLRDERRGES